jgi:hypothetical protein
VKRAKNLKSEAYYFAQIALLLKRPYKDFSKDSGVRHFKQILNQKNVFASRKISTSTLEKLEEIVPFSIKAAVAAEQLSENISASTAVIAYDNGRALCYLRVRFLEKCKDYSKYKTFLQSIIADQNLPPSFEKTCQKHIKYYMELRRTGVAESLIGRAKNYSSLQPLTPHLHAYFAMNARALEDLKAEEKA